MKKEKINISISVNGLNDYLKSISNTKQGKKVIIDLINNDLLLNIAENSILKDVEK